MTICNAHQEQALLLNQNKITLEAQLSVTNRVWMKLRMPAALSLSPSAL